MPNWCSNSLTLTCPSKREADELCLFLEKKDTRQDEGEAESLFSYFLPEPEHEVGPDDAMPSWYWWRVNNWGTKWSENLYDWNKIDETTIQFSFDTAWSPPIGVYEAMHEAGYVVEAQYFEPGMCFVGSWIEGSDEYFEYSSCETVKELREKIPTELDDYWRISEDWWVEEEDEEILAS